MKRKFTKYPSNYVKASSKIQASTYYIGGYDREIKDFSNDIKQYHCRIQKDPDDPTTYAVVGNKEDLEALYNAGLDEGAFDPNFLQDMDIL